MSGWQMPSGQELAAWGAAVVAAALGAFRIWRTSSKTGLDNTKDEEEGSGLKYVMATQRRQVEDLRAERDASKKESDEAWTQRMLDAATIAKLEAQNVHLQSEVAALRAQVDQLQKTVSRYLPADATIPLPRRDA